MYTGHIRYLFRVENTRDELLPPNPKELEAFAEREWFVLFSHYSGTLEYIAALKERLAPEQVWPALCAHPENARAFSSSFHPYDERPEILN